MVMKIVKRKSVRLLKEGEVLHPAFSAHSLLVAEEAMITREFEVLQVPFSFVDSEAKEKVVQLPNKLNMSCIGGWKKSEK